MRSFRPALVLLASVSLLGVALSPSEASPLPATNHVTAKAAPAASRAATSLPAPVKSSSKVTILYRVKTKNRVVFLTVDDGSYRLPSTYNILAHTPSVLFPTGGMVGAGKAYWRALAKDGRLIENHTYSHPDLKTLSFSAQKSQICRASDMVQKTVGVRPYLFRPPYGNYNNSTVQAAGACGLRYLVLWDVTLQSGKMATYGGPIKAGDIVLMHFTKTFASDFKLLQSRMRKQGLTFASLNDYLK